VARPGGHQPVARTQRRRHAAAHHFDAERPKAPRRDQHTRSRGNP
jgi:hypothetical protein